MCGIIGYIGNRKALPIILCGLKHLEYRGYDSAGLVIGDGAGFRWEKCSGKIDVLEAKLKGKVLNGSVGLGHTRWATHGAPTRENAHPHFSCDRRIYVVHNGIIENFAELRHELARKHKFTSQTDTEVIAHLAEQFYRGDPLDAVRKTLGKIHGSYALGFCFADNPDRLIVARHGSPLVLGVNEVENFVASDVAALLPHTKKVVYLEDGEIACIKADGVNVFSGAKERKVIPHEIHWSERAAGKEGFAHFMLKEIHEIPKVAEAELAGRDDFSEIKLARHFNRIVITACGTAYHAGLYGKYAIESLAGIPCDLWAASELRYGFTPINKNTLVLAISQSGETADTISAVRLAHQKGAKVLAITNIKGSTISREADWMIFMRAGLEIGVAATKTYVSQLILLAMFAIKLKGDRHLFRQLATLPAKLNEIIENQKAIKQAAARFKEGHDFMYIGRKFNLATAYEGALKMKEITYRHAEGYGAGEMKHGPLALVDEKLVTVAIVLQDSVYAKMISNIQEIKARKGKIIAVATAGDSHIRHATRNIFYIPKIEEIFSPILSVVPLQLLAYWTAASIGRDVDQPRNLAKSVTVE